MRGSAWVVVALTSAGCLGVMVKAAVKGPPTTWRDFTHQTHLAKDLECKDCHGDVAKSDLAEMPRKDTCTQCHELTPGEEPKPYTRSIVEATEIAWKPRSHREGVRFSHKVHADAKCATCHGDVSEVPPQALCASCHAEGGVDPRCGTCHEAARFATPPDTHGAGWQRRHGREALAGVSLAHGRDCFTCHEDGACAQCHREEKPADHNTAWRTRTHGMYAAFDRDRCAVCHTEDTCVRCHSETPPRSHRGGWSSTRETHCLTCHEPVSGESCAACHQGTPGHLAAKPQPSTPRHDPGMDCRSCHGITAPMPHTDNGGECNACHR